MNPILHLLAPLPNFLAYLGTALGLTVLFSILYTAITPHEEWKMLRKGNISASLAFGGALLGFAIPLASAIAHSVSLLDTVLWGLVALIVQLLAFYGVWLILPRLPRQIEEDHRGVATIAAVFFLSVGLLNAACLVW
jgi:putative membrane protein